MRKCIYFLLPVLAFSCQGPSDGKKSPTRLEPGTNPQDTALSSGDSAIVESSFSEFNTFQSYRLHDTIRVDLTGDGKEDRAFLDGHPKRLTVLRGGHEQPIIVGDDKSFDGVANDLSWVDLWGITKDSTAGEVVIENDELVGSRETKLLHPSIVLRRKESGGGVVTYRNGVFCWVHQSD